MSLDRTRTPLTVLALLAATFAGSALTSCRDGASSREPEPATTPPRSELHREIVAATGAVRLFEPRLTGGFAYAPCEAPPGDVEDAAPSLTCQPLSAPPAARLRTWSKLAAGARTAGGDPLAVWQLSAPGGPASPASAVTLLRQATASGGDAGVCNDLAVALILQARSRDDPRLLVEALGWLERALEIEPAMPESLFNEAILLRDLGLHRAAAEAWRRYARRDPGSGWRREALDGARLASSFAAPDDELADLLTELAAGDAAVAVRATRLDRRRVRELATDELFGLWAAAYLSGDEPRADRLLTVLTAVGTELESTSGDATVRLGVAALRRTLQRGAHAAADLAKAHAELARARQLLRDSRYGDAQRPLERARPAFAAAGSPFTAWTDESLAVATLTGNDYGAARRHLERLQARAHREATPALEARLWWNRGLIEIRTGLYEESLRSFTRSAEVSRAMGETFPEGGALALAAESYRALGRSEESWQTRARAFRLLDREASGPLHNLLLDAADDARVTGYPLAAARLQTLGLANARLMGSRSREVECLLWRSAIWSAAGRPELARHDLEEARHYAEEIRDEQVRRRLLADLDTATATAWGSGRAGEARDRLADALATYEAIGFRLRLPGLYLQRARLSLALGDETAAESDLRAAVRAYERPGSGHVRETFQREYFESAQEAYETLLRLLLDQGRTTLALAVSERARMAPVERLAAASRELRGEAPDRAPESVSEAGLRAAAARLPADTALIEYFVLPRSLAVWRIADGRIEHWRRPLAASELRRRVNGLWTAWRQNEADARGQAEDLYRDLLAAAVADLEPGRHLVFVPDRALAKVPFAALVDPRSGRRLLEDYEVSSTLSLGFYLHGPRRRAPGLAGAPGEVVLVGDPETGARLPRLAGARREVEEIRALYPGALLLDGAHATRSAILAALPRAEIFHFAGHAVRDDRSPWASYLPVAGENGGERLYARDLLGLKLPRLRLAVLAACSSAAPREERTLAVSGLALALLSSGAPAVVVSLEPVDDAVAEQLLPAFHRRYRSGLTAPAALRAAILQHANLGPEKVSDWAALVVWSHQRFSEEGALHDADPDHHADRRMRLRAGERQAGRLHAQRNAARDFESAPAAGPPADGLAVRRSQRSARSPGAPADLPVVEAPSELRRKPGAHLQPRRAGGRRRTLGRATTAVSYPCG